MICDFADCDAYPYWSIASETRARAKSCVRHLDHVMERLDGDVFMVRRLGHV